MRVVARVVGRRAKRDSSRAGLTALSLIVGAYAAACAADAGDPLKVEGGLTTQSMGTPDGTIVGDDALGTSDATVADESTSVGADGSMTTPPEDTGTTMIQDSGTPPIVDTGSPPDVGVGAGCAMGATVIALVLPAGQYTANTQNFGTTGPVCVELMGSVHQGWGLSNEQGRTLTLTSSAGTSAPIDASQYSTLPDAPQAGPDGFVYWNFSADDAGVNYTSLYIF
jgi:hypothetical protein